MKDSFIEEDSCQDLYDAALKNFRRSPQVVTSNAFGTHYADLAGIFNPIDARYNNLSYKDKCILLTVIHCERFYAPVIARDLSPVKFFVNRCTPTGLKCLHKVNINSYAYLANKINITLDLYLSKLPCITNDCLKTKADAINTRNRLLDFYNILNSYENGQLKRKQRNTMEERELVAFDKLLPKELGHMLTDYRRELVHTILQTWFRQLLPRIVTEVLDNSYIFTLKNVKTNLRNTIHSHIVINNMMKSNKNMVSRLHLNLQELGIPQKIIEKISIPKLQSPQKPKRSYLFSANMNLNRLSPLELSPQASPRIDEKKEDPQQEQSLNQLGLGRSISLYTSRIT